MSNEITIEQLKEAVAAGCKNKTAIKDYLGLGTDTFYRVLIRLGLPQDSKALLDRLKEPVEELTTPTHSSINTFAPENIIYVSWDQQREASIRNRLKRIKIIQNKHGITPSWAKKVYADAFKYGIRIDEDLILDQTKKTFLDVSTININEGE